MLERVELPEGLAQLPPGPELAAVLAGVDPARLNGHDLVTLAPAYVKMISHLQAGLATVLDQIQHSPPGDATSPPARTEHMNRWAEIEIAAKLHWTAGKADYELRYADQMVRRLPMVHAALASGEIDFPRARTIIDGVSCLGEQPAQLLAAGILAAGAGRWNTAQLARKLRRAVVAYDAAAAARRRAQRQAQRRVQVQAHPDGTADLFGLNLPPDRVAAAVERIRAIARTAKRQGDQRSIDQLMADTMVDLLAGTGIGATPPQPVTNPGPTGHPDHLGHAPTDEPDHDPADESIGETDADPAEPVGEPDDQPDGAPAPTGAPVPLPGPRRGTIELVAPLSTLFGIAEAPGEVAGYGPVAADLVRPIVAAQPDAQWRFSIYNDDTGDILHHGSTLTRPIPPQPGTPDPHRNGFRAADVAFIRARDRTCRAPQGCTVPATACETDHTLARAEHGEHHRDNAGALCKRDHTYKHQSGATLEQPEPGVFTWTTPLGHSYTVRPEPYDESTGPPGQTENIASQRLARLFTHHPPASRGTRRRGGVAAGGSRSRRTDDDDPADR